MTNRFTTLYLTWLNNLGGFEYFPFQADKEYLVNVEETGETSVNLLPNWGESYGEFADTIKKQTYRKSRNSILVKSQHLTSNQVNAFYQIRTSPLVQIINDRYDRRTVIVDSDSFKKYSELDQLYTMQFTILFTDQIPSQRA